LPWHGAAFLTSREDVRSREPDLAKVESLLAAVLGTLWFVQRLVAGEGGAS
jgi:hypothetical protein